MDCLQTREKEIAHRKARRVRRAENALDVFDEFFVAVVDDVVGHSGLDFPLFLDHGQQIRAVCADPVEALADLGFLGVECAV